MSRIAACGCYHFLYLSDKSDRFAKIKLAADFENHRESVLDWDKKLSVNFIASKTKLLSIDPLKDSIISLHSQILYTVHSWSQVFPRHEAMRVMLNHNYDARNI